MAEQDRIGSLPNFLFSSDGGLLALNLGSLTFVAGLTRYAGLADIANVRILSGGLCVSLFFAMLCVYFTLIGVRATAAGRARLIARHGAALRPPLPVPGDPIPAVPGQQGADAASFDFDQTLPIAVDVDYPVLWFLKFSIYAIAFAAPALALVFFLNWQEPRREAHINAITQIQSQQSDAHYDKQAGDPACLSQSKDLAKCRKELASISAEENMAILAAILIYLAWPLAAWCATSPLPQPRTDGSASAAPAHDGAYLFRPRLYWDDRIIAAAPPRPDPLPPGALPSPASPSLHDPARRASLADLVQRASNIQSLRMVCAFVSLAIFVAAVGLALVDTGIHSVNAAAATTAPVIASTTTVAPPRNDPAPAQSNQQTDLADAIKDQNKLISDQTRATEYLARAVAALNEKLSDPALFARGHGSAVPPVVNVSIPDKIALTLPGTITINNKTSGTQSMQLTGLDKIMIASPQGNTPPEIFEIDKNCTSFWIFGSDCSIAPARTVETKEPVRTVTSAQP